MSFVCTYPLCAFEADSRLTLVVHQRAHHANAPLPQSDDARPFKCPTCSYAGKTRRRLENHLKSCPATKVYQCTQCAFTTRHKGSFHTHQLRHVPERERPFQCPHCPRGLTTAVHLKEHIASYHQEAQFECRQCGKQYTCERIYKQHLARHQHQKMPAPFSCDHCDYETHDKRSFQRHTDSHFGVYRFSCPHCDYQCQQSQYLKAHCRRQHPTVSF